MTKINEINVELSGNSQRYVNKCCESESDGKIDGFSTHCWECRGGFAIAMWCGMCSGCNLGLTPLMKRRGERRGGAAWRLGKKDGAEERGNEGRDMGSPKVTGSSGTGMKGSGWESGVESRGGGGLAAL
jgi:hypothetical protein